MTSINTNLSALNAQNNLQKQTKEMDQSMARLASGLRINSAADDAAGSAIASKMEATVRSLGVAIRNANDAISLTQTAEGALGEIENILQRMRELSVQAGNSTLSASDRSAIQDEVTALTAEINDIASSTNFNGVQLLDGTNSSIDFQVGVDATDALSVDLQSSSAADLGLSGSMGANVLTSGRIVLGTTEILDEDGIKFNGENFLSANIADISSVTNGANVIAAGINLNTSVHGVVATAFNRVVGAEMGADFQMTATLAITTEGAAETIAIQSSMSDLVDQINLQVQGVTASLGANNSLILENTNGNNIIIGNGGNEVGFTEDTYEGMFTLENVDGSAVKIELGNLANGYVQAVTATPTSLGQYGLNETDGKVTKSIAVTSSVLATTDQIKINDVMIGATTLNSAEAKAAAINAVSSASGVTATATTTMFVDLNFDQNATDTSFEVNGTAIAVSTLNSVSDVAAAINTADVGVKATASTEGLLKLFDAGGGNITIDLLSPTSYVTTVTDADNAEADTAQASAENNPLEPPINSGYDSNEEYFDVELEQIPGAQPKTPLTAANVVSKIRESYQLATFNCNTDDDAEFFDAEFNDFYDDDGDGE